MRHGRAAALTTGSSLHKKGLFLASEYSSVVFRCLHPNTHHFWTQMFSDKFQIQKQKKKKTQIKSFGVLNGSKASDKELHLCIYHREKPSSWRGVQFSVWDKKTRERHVIEVMLSLFSKGGFALYMSLTEITKREFPPDLKNEYLSEHTIPVTVFLRFEDWISIYLYGVLCWGWVSNIFNQSNHSF